MPNRIRKSYHITLSDEANAKIKEYMDKYELNRSQAIEKKFGIYKQLKKPVSA